MAHRCTVTRSATLGSYDRREYMIEEWVYGPSNGMLSILRFEGNRLTAIERRCER